MWILYFQTTIFNRDTTITELRENLLAAAAETNITVQYRQMRKYGGTHKEKGRQEHCALDSRGSTECTFQ